MRWVLGAVSAGLVVAAALVAAQIATAVPPPRLSVEASTPVVKEAVPPKVPNVYAATVDPRLSQRVADVPVRVYVPNSAARTVTVIDPATFQVVGVVRAGRVPHHVTPSWDLARLYVNNTESDSLTVIDPRTSAAVGTVPVVDPYNLYFTPDGTKAIVVAERHRRLDFYDPASWALLKSVPVPWPGVDHGDFSADGRWFVASTEFSGQVVKVDTVAMEVVANASVGGLPVDVKVSPDGSAFFVANQSRHGVSILDSQTLAEVGFLPTGLGAHGLSLSRDATALYVSNRLAGTVSVVELSTRTVRSNWAVGGSPDMLQVSADGRQLWASNRFGGTVSVIDTASGALMASIPAGAGAHGLTLFPQPGRYSIGHNGVYR